MSGKSQQTRWLDALTYSRVAVGALLFVLCVVASAQDLAKASLGLPLDKGFSGLYNLDFAGAQKHFSVWQKLHPDDPVGPVSEAAGLLFSEFNRLGVLEAQFYENDNSFVDRPKLTPDPATRSSFEAAVARAETLAQARLAKDPKDRDALFALTLASGLRADYAALIDKRNFESLRYTRQASATGHALLATGFSKYIIGSMAAPVRWVLRMGGFPADKQGGIADLRLAAERGRYLAPYARILLSIAYVREKNNEMALEVLTALQREFPGNP